MDGCSTPPVSRWLRGCRCFLQKPSSNSGHPEWGRPSSWRSGLLVEPVGLQRQRRATAPAGVSFSAFSLIRSCWLTREQLAEKWGKEADRFKRRRFLFQRTRAAHQEEHTGHRLQTAPRRKTSFRRKRV